MVVSWKVLACCSVLACAACGGDPLRPPAPGDTAAPLPGLFLRIVSAGRTYSLSDGSAIPLVPDPRRPTDPTPAIFDLVGPLFGKISYMSEVRVTVEDTTLVTWSSTDQFEGQFLRKRRGQTVVEIAVVDPPSTAPVMGPFGVIFTVEP